ncbi:MAG: cytochrome b, partial [Enterobacteriaceae bacterium]
MFGVGLWMTSLSYYSPWYHEAPHLHKSVGILLAAVMVARLVWRLCNPTPAALPNHGPLLRLMAKLGHLAIYLLIFITLFAGYLISTADGQPIMVFDWFTVPALITDIPDQADIAGTVHLTAAWTLIILALAHGAMAIKHHFIDKDSTLKRMLGH